MARMHRLCALARTRTHMRMHVCLAAKNEDTVPFVLAYKRSEKNIFSLQNAEGGQRTKCSTVILGKKILKTLGVCVLVCAHVHISAHKHAQVCTVRVHAVAHSIDSSTTLYALDEFCRNEGSFYSIPAQS